MADKRKLTEAEEKRLAAYQEKCEEMKEKGFSEHRITASVLSANITGVLLAAVPCIILGILFFLCNRDLEFSETGFLSYIIFVILYVVTIVIHELLHGLFWSFSTKNGFADIEFGFMKEYLTPYCTCRAPLGKKQYILGLLAPFAILGVLISVIGIFTGSMFVLGIGLINIIGAGGDLLIFVKLLADRGGKDAVYLDLPTEIGLARFDRN